MVLTENSLKAASGLQLQRLISIRETPFFSRWTQKASAANLDQCLMHSMDVAESVHCCWSETHTTWVFCGTIYSRRAIPYGSALVWWLSQETLDPHSSWRARAFTSSTLKTTSPTLVLLKILQYRVHQMHEPNPAGLGSVGGVAAPPGVEW